MYDFYTNVKMLYYDLIVNLYISYVFKIVKIKQFIYKEGIKSYVSNVFIKYQVYG